MLQQKLKQLQAKKAQRGLTLLETMLVIAIIALFAGAILYLYLSVKSLGVKKFNKKLLTLPKLSVK